ncbi:MAG: DUF86 domain-containing protein [Campylobacterales bacterium]|nr:DUF86 domain-containing protein [Campylobacterales bacterium]
MSKVSSHAKVLFVLKMIHNIEEIVKRHDGIVKVLEDEIEAQPALLMCLMQIGENIKKIDLEYLEKFDLLIDSKGSYDVRNFIAHDYEGVNLVYIEGIVRDRLPVLKEKFNQLKELFENDSD